MSILAFLSATALAQPAGAVHVGVSTANPLPVTVTGGGGGGLAVGGLAANGAAFVNNPVWMAGYDGTLIRAIKTDTLGNIQLAPDPSLWWNYQITGSAGATIRAAPGAGLRHYITDIQFQNVSTALSFSSGGLIWQTRGGTPIVSPVWSTFSFKTPLICGVNSNLTFVGTLDALNVQGYTAP